MIDFYVSLPVSGVIGCTVCTKADWEKICRENISSEWQERFIRKYAAAEIKDFERSQYIRAYIKALKDIKHEFMDLLEIPQNIPDGKKPCKLRCCTSAEHLVYTHTGVDFIRQGDVDIVTWWQWVADAYKYNILANLGDKGEEELNECWYFMHDEPDIEAIKGL